jgi:hypothetical protein
MRLPRGMVCLLAVVGVLAPAQRSWAQTVTTPGEALLEILSGGVVFQGEVVITAIAAPALTFPISSSASGFTFYFDSQLQQVVPASNSFGSLFSERALTNGRGRFSFSGNYQRKRWRSIDGFDLDGGLQFVAKWQLDHPSLLDGYPMRPGDTENFIATLHFDTDVMVLAANYGVSDRLDVGVAAPIMRTDISGSHRVTRTLVSGEEMTVTAPVHVASSATGLGDLFVRAKYNVFRNNTLSLAGVGEVRLPTGSTENLHGVGVTVPKGTVVASFRYDRLAPHVNVAYARGDGGIPFRNFDAGLNAFRPGCPPPAEDPSCRTPSLEDRYLALTDEVT